jgi:hypothetical protein
MTTRDVAKVVRISRAVTDSSRKETPGAAGVPRCPETLSSSFERFWREVEAGHLSPDEASKRPEGGE